LPCLSKGNRCCKQGATPQRAPLFAITSRAAGAHAASAMATEWYHHDSGLFVSCGKDSTARLWDPNTATLVRSVHVGQHALALAMAPAAAAAARVAVACGDGRIHLLDVLSGSLGQSLSGAWAIPLACACCVQLAATCCSLWRCDSHREVTDQRAGPTQLAATTARQPRMRLQASRGPRCAWHGLRHACMRWLPVTPRGTFSSGTHGGPACFTHSTSSTRRATLPAPAPTPPVT
jgi:hypothetical protein